MSSDRGSQKNFGGSRLAERDENIRREEREKTIAEVREMCEAKVKEFNEQLRGQSFLDFARELESLK